MSKVRYKNKGDMTPEEFRMIQTKIDTDHKTSTYMGILKSQQCLSIDINKSKKRKKTKAKRDRIYDLSSFINGKT